jgi:hypothetical protein
MVMDLDIRAKEILYENNIIHALLCHWECDF